MDGKVYVQSLTFKRMSIPEAIKLLTYEYARGADDIGGFRVHYPNPKTVQKMTDEEKQAARDRAEAELRGLCRFFAQIAVEEG